MIFEWDEEKSRSNRIKHGIDFEMAKAMWNDDNLVVIHVPYPLETRRIVMGKIHEKLWVGVYTLRGDAVRMISVRRASKKEVKLYEKN